MKQTLKRILPLRVVAAIRAALFYRFGEPEVRWLAKLVDRSRASVDVGANNGAYTWWLSLFSQHVYAFEPNPAFEKDILASGRNVTASNIALSNSTGEASLFIPYDPLSGDDLTGLASLMGADKTNSRQIDVRCAPLDSLGLPPIGFIKIDVEGHEIQVLDGAAELIRRDRPNILIEAEERHKTHAIESVVAWFEAVGMVGFFLDGKRGWVSIAEFNADVHQRIDSAGPVGPRMARSYRNNFLFLCAREVKRHPFLPVHHLSRG